MLALEASRALSAEQSRAAATTAREPEREARFVRIPPDGAIDVGRGSKRYMLAFQEPTMAEQHLRPVLEEAEAYRPPPRLDPRRRPSGKPRRLGTAASGRSLPRG